MNVLILGGAGFLGSYLTGVLMHKHPDASITIVDPMTRPAALYRLNLACRQFATRPFSGKIIPKRHQDLEARHYVPFKPDVIFHIAELAAPGMNDAIAISENVNGIDAITQYIIGIKRECKLVIASSAAVYGNPITEDGVMREDMAGYPGDCYGFSKWMLECEVRRAMKVGVDAKILRFFNLYGPGDHTKQMMASQLTHIGAAILNGTAPKYFEAGDQVRDWLDVREAAFAMLQAPQWKPGTYNIGSGVGMTFLGAIVCGMDVLGSTIEAGSQPLPPQLRESFPRASVADISMAIREGWQPLRVGKHAIRDYFTWMLAEHQRDDSAFSFFAPPHKRPVDQIRGP